MVRVGGAIRTISTRILDCAIFVIAGRRSLRKSGIAATNWSVTCRKSPERHTRPGRGLPSGTLVAVAAGIVAVFAPLALARYRRG